ncbi:hypothetical protein [Dactylosporangium matsuzakiense]|uniref:Uncharacterized protein n=1 Tax=Dactylosporangium matsuzakiense TaxID=53360 RepID=A0A9W6KV33_9ACTN|nr:hypothetical protein [Dactylosporangium matsuzakiense]UWZ47704.1 hypothetical protein Dmats_15640 [Dactylosporangium matsuzakiense]GLL07833.1 hypothetical protein GCM10017581_095910 [Dactylosporangium matsuzakiense]
MKLGTYGKGLSLHADGLTCFQLRLTCRTPSGDVDLGHGNAWDPTGLDKAVMIALLLSGWIFATTIVATAGRALSRP